MVRARRWMLGPYRAAAIAGAGVEGAVSAVISGKRLPQGEIGTEGDDGDVSEKSPELGTQLVAGKVREDACRRWRSRNGFVPVAAPFCDDGLIPTPRKSARDTSSELAVWVGPHLPTWLTP